MAERCRNCPEDAIGWVQDPYDYITMSPIDVGLVAYCLHCYNRRVLGALRYVLQQLQRHEARKVPGHS